MSNLHRTGYTIIRNAVSVDDVQEYRRTVLANRSLMKRTRPTPSSRHLAGFHRFKALDSLHAAMIRNAKIASFLRVVFQGEKYTSIGLTDITINRSQQWHTDLLRGAYRRYLDQEACWGSNGGGVYKLLFYLQTGDSLRVAAGKHRGPVPLDDRQLDKSLDRNVSSAVAVDVGDVIVMDIRLPHRGASEAQMQDKALEDNPKILISTVLGGVNHPLTRQMQLGNAVRLAHWDQRDVEFQR